MCLLSPCLHICITISECLNCQVTISKRFAFHFIDTSTMSTANIKTTPSQKPENESINTHKEVVDGTRDLKGEGVDIWNIFVWCHSCGTV